MGDGFEEQASQQATQQAKQLAAKTQQIEALKEAAAITQQALDAAQQEQDRLKSEQVAASRRYHGLESTLAQHQLREHQLKEVVAAREAALEEKTEELAALVASTKDEAASAQATADILEKELAAAIEARDNALRSVATSEQASSAELIKAEQHIVELEARLQAEREALDGEAARADAAEAASSRTTVACWPATSTLPASARARSTAAAIVSGEASVSNCFCHRSTLLRRLPAAGMIVTSWPAPGSPMASVASRIPAGPDCSLQPSGSV